MWVELVLLYQKHHKRTQIAITKDADSPLFCNPAIKRRLSPQAIQAVLDELCKQGYGEWQDANRTVCSTSSRTLSEWAVALSKWAQASGAHRTVCTLYELHDGDETRGEDFHGLDLALLLGALKVLEQGKKAALIPGQTLAETGVKFL